MIATRRPWIAALLSLGVPGLGHLYAGRVGAAAGALLVAAGAAVAALSAALLLPVPPLNALLILPAILLVYIGVPLHAGLAASRAPVPYELRPYNRWYIYLGLCLLSAVVLRPSIYGFTKAHIVDAFRIPSATMEPTILAGDYVYVAKWSSAVRSLRAGSLVVFESVEDPSLTILKRIVGLPRDTLEMQGGRLYRNGGPVPEPYAVHRDPTRSEDAVQRARMRHWQAKYVMGKELSAYAPDLQDWGPIVVPPDSLFVLGDNRDASYDSRYYGFIGSRSIVGRPWVIYFSYDPYDPESSGIPFDRVRWSRLGQPLF